MKALIHIFAGLFVLAALGLWFFCAPYNYTHHDLSWSIVNVLGGVFCLVMASIILDSDNA